MFMAPAELVLAPRLAQGLVVGEPVPPVAARAPREVQRIGDAAVDEREGPQDQEVEQRQEDAREHVPEALGEREERLHAVRTGMVGQGGEGDSSTGGPVLKAAAALPACRAGPTEGRGV